MKTTDDADATDQQGVPLHRPVRTARSVWSAVTCHRFGEATCRRRTPHRVPAPTAGRPARPRRGTSPPARKRRQVAALHTLRAFLRPWLLLALLLVAVLLAGGAGAATLTVTNLADNGPGTLRQRIADASPGETLDFAVTGTITLTSGELVIHTNLIDR